MTMTASEWQPASGSHMVSPATRLGAVHLAITDARRALALWRDLLGLTVLSEEGDAIHLGVDNRTLIVLQPGAARPVAPHTSDLYHVAIHVPTPSALPRVIARLFAAP